MKSYKIIFDMDGTLYQFDKGSGQTFASSQFYAELKNKGYELCMKARGLSMEAAVIEYERIKEKYNGEVSIGFETEYGIDRYSYFDATWNVDPEKYIKKDTELPEMFQKLNGEIALLTAAPKVWATSVLRYLQIDQYFQGNIYTGEQNERKPNPIAFQKIVECFGVAPETIISIGDQEYSDIIPAKSVGMKKVLIGSSSTSSADYQAPDVKTAITLLRKEGLI